ncbi:MAG: transposase [Opitutae bacterium]|nr:transposase [Opitutae bacterium]
MNHELPQRRTMKAELPQRRTLHHAPPTWVANGSLFFVTICAETRGVNSLCTDPTGPRLLDSARDYQERQTWWLKLFLLMPDHLHMLVGFPADRAMATVIRAWKSYQTRALGVRWQSGFFDHRLRSDESEDAKTEYIRMNPVRAGLVARTEDWRFVWPVPRAGDGSSGTTRPTD